MDDLKFSVPAVPVAQPRPRAGKGPGGRPQLYQAETSHPVHSFKATCRLAAAEVHSGPPIEGPLCLTALFVMPRPQRLRWKTRAMPRMPKPDGPDVDNLAKTLMDALTGLLWVDDRQVYRLNVSKWHAADDEPPHVEVTIWRECQEG